MKEENDYSPRRGWSMEEIATLSELKAKGTDLYDKEAWKNYTSRTLPWTKEELRIVKEIMENGGDAKNAALRVPHSPNEIYRKMSFMSKDFFDESTWDKYATD